MEIFCTDRNTYQAHNDVIQPVFDANGRFQSFFTLCEGGGDFSRVTMYDAGGRRLWGKLDAGHLHHDGVVHRGGICFGWNRLCNPQTKREDHFEHAWTFDGQEYPRPFAVRYMLRADSSKVRIQNAASN